MPQYSPFLAIGSSPLQAPITLSNPGSMISVGNPGGPVVFATLGVPIIAGITRSFPSNLVGATAQELITT